MILKASQRSGSMQLALHLMNDRDNEHVSVHEVNGFIADNLADAFQETYAISRGTKCKQFLFSLSLSPPEKEKVPIEVFERAIADIETKLKLTGQPRAIVFHEKEGRRHAHCVWSRIDIQTMTAINLPHFKLKLRDISRQLYLDNEWEVPRGLINSAERNPLNFTLAEWQQAKRIKQDPRIIKQVLQNCWAISDSRNAFQQALKERGYYLAKGDRRGFVAVDWRGNVLPISRWVGVKSKEIKAKLGNPDNLLSIVDVKNQFKKEMTAKKDQFKSEASVKHNKLEKQLQIKIDTMSAQHRDQREQLKSQHTEKQIRKTIIRSRRLPTGLKAIWFRVTGKYKKIKQQNESESHASKQRDQSEFQQLIERQLNHRRKLQHERRLLRHHHSVKLKTIINQTQPNKVQSNLQIRVKHRR